MNDFAALLCGTIVFRGAIYKNWIKNGKVRWQAFKRREDNYDGVSLSMIPDKFEGLDNPVEGVISVHVGYVRDISNEEYVLDIKQDKKLHANITGLLCADLYEGEEKIKIYEDMKSVCGEIAENAAREYLEVK